MDEHPITPFGNGRDNAGRFAPGNPGGPGNPHSRRTAELRRILHEEATEADLRAVLRTMIEQAKAGDVRAARELLDRLFGRPKPMEEAAECGAPAIQIILSEAENPYDDPMGIIKEFAHVLDRLPQGELPRKLRDWLSFVQTIKSIRPSESDVAMPVAPNSAPVARVGDLSSMVTL